MTLQELFQSIADAIREKTGETGKLKPTAYPEKIRGITGSGLSQEYVDSIFEGTIKTVKNDTARFLYASAFRGFPSLQSVEMNNVGDIQSEALKNAAALESANFPKAGMILSNAFENCFKLNSINVSNAESIGSYAFKMCKSLQEVSFNTQVTIGTYAFQGCTALQKVEIAQLGDDSFAANAFSGCTALTAVVIRSVNYYPAPKTSAFAGTPIANGGGYIYVPRNELNWMQYESEWTGNYDLRAIEDWPEITGG